MAFLACGVTTGNMNQMGSDCKEAESAEDMKLKMTSEAWESVYEMGQDMNLYSNLITSLFPTIHGNDEVKRGSSLGDSSTAKS